MLIVFLGDSITEGLGVLRSGKTYANMLQAELSTACDSSVRILNFGASAMQVHESRTKHEKEIVELQPDLIVFAHGTTESVVREQRKYLKYLPKRWRRPGWMDPRPYFSSKRSRRWMERVESAIRWRVKAALIKVFGGSAWMSLEDFRQETADFIETILNSNSQTNFILLAPADIEERFFPKSPASLQKMRAELNEIYESFKHTGRVFMCDSSQVLHKWNDYFEDRFHPNESGHAQIANVLFQTMEQNSLINIARDRVLEEVSR